MAEYIEKDYHYSTRYALIKNGERIEFNSDIMQIMEEEE